MHSFPELMARCATYTIFKLNETEHSTIEALQTSGATPLVATLKMIQMQRVIMAVGMFSLFESILQDRLNCVDGFAAATKVLEEENETAIGEKFSDFQKAINVLKHGRGRSYDALVAKAPKLAFNIKLPNQTFFHEGDVSEESAMLIEVDDQFIMNCAKTIEIVSSVIKRARAQTWVC